MSQFKPFYPKNAINDGAEKESSLVEMGFKPMLCEDKVDGMPVGLFQRGKTTVRYEYTGEYIVTNKHGESLTCAHLGEIEEAFAAVNAKK